MSIQPPKIDNRTYEDIVAQTVKLVQHYTAGETSESVENQPENLLDRTLAEDIKDTDGKTIATAGTLIDEKLAGAIAQVNSLKQINVKVKGWSKPAKPDAGLALIRIFGRMAATVSDRLNRVPEKNFLAFLDLLGTQILPPQPARVPLTFYLASGIPETTTALVPAYTQISAPPAEGEEEEVVFETASDLLVTPVQLQAVFVRSLKEDKYSDRTLQATGKIDASFLAFVGDSAIEHYLYLASELFALPAPKTVTLNIESSNAAEWNKLSLTWDYWDGTAWQLLLSTTSIDPVIINKFPAITPHTINGLNAAWLRVKLLSPPAKSPQINRITATVNIDRNNLTTPDRCFFNTIPIDLSKDFYPFGEQPRFNDTFYIAIDEVFAKPKAQVTVDVKLSDPPPMPVNPSADLEIKWENWNGNEWDSLLTSSFSDLTKNFTQHGKVSFTLPSKVAAKTINGETSYWVRARITKGNYSKEASYKQHIQYKGGTKLKNRSKKNDIKLLVEDAKDFLPGSLIWIGVGELQEVDEIVSISVSNNELTLKTNLVYDHDLGTSVVCFVYDLTLATFGPPSLQSLKLSYTYHDTASISACRTYNDFTYLDPFGSDRFTTISEDAAIGKTIKVDSIGSLAVGDRISIDPGNQSSFYEIEAAPDTKTLTLKTQLTQAYSKGTQVFCCFHPFTPTDDEQPSLYLGFDRPFPNRPIALYFQVELPTCEELSAATTNAAKPRLVWEYFNGKNWTKLSVIDETAAFSDRGLIKFIGPSDFTETQEFGKTLYWLRVCWESGEFRVQPRLRRILTNTIWASQTTTLHNEILGSSNGNPDRTFRTVKSPILPGQQLEVQEQKIPPLEEQKEIEKLEGTDAITVVRDEKGEVETVWVRWHEVSDFYESGTRDRHYTLNRLTGEIQFGDGKYGLIPPQIRNNIRMARYKTDGGAKGNKPAETINQLKTTIPFIDRVTNLEAAAGGSDRDRSIE
ncbi:MAG: baseplate protein J [Microcoleus sp. SU_5_3]|nr:baseplate protein J [Microcoleus sp. SU_5_3]